MKRILAYLSLDKVGFLEMILALYPLLLAYRYGIIILAQVVLLFLDVIVLLRRKNHIVFFAPLMVFFVYYILHQFFGIIAWGLTQSYYINSFIGCIIYVSSIFIIAPNVRFDKLEGSINWVSIICLIGLFYHGLLMLQGGLITPLKIPFLPDPDTSQTRVFDEGLRPVSFFMEPQSYVGYMIFTLFYAIRREKYIWAAIVSISFIISTSTTGIAMIPVMFVLYILTGHSKWYRKLLLVVLLVAAAVFLFRSSIASFGLEKMEETSLSTNIRTVNGPAMAQTMDIGDLFIGVPYANATDYYYGAGLSQRSAIIPDGQGNVFLPGFWTCLIFYGIFGLILFLAIYYKIWKLDHDVLPILGCLVVALFTNPDFLGGIWSFQIIYMLVFVKRNIKKPRYESINNNHAVC